MTNRRERAADRLAVVGLQFVGKHGVYEHEREEGRRFRVDLYVEVDTKPAADSDQLEDALDYRTLAAAVVDVGLGTSYHLIESLADAMASRLLADRRVASVELSLRKYADGVPGDPEWVGITIARHRDEP